MEEIKENKSIVTSYRLSQETKDKLQQQLKGLGMTQEQYFNKVVGVMELENVKKNSFLAKDTTIIQSCLDTVLNTFISIADDSNTLISNKDVELEAIKIKYKDMQSNKENLITEQKQELQEVYSNLLALQNEDEEHKNELFNIKIEYDKQVDQFRGSLKDKHLIVDEYKIKNDDLLSLVTEYKHYKIELEEYKKLLADSKSRNSDLSNGNKDKDYNINQLNETIIKLPLEHQKQFEQLKKENQLNIKLAVAEVKEELSNKLGQQQLKYNKEIELYQYKYKELLQELEKRRITPKAIKKDSRIVIDNKK